MRQTAWPTRIGQVALAIGALSWIAAFAGATMVRYELGGSKLAGFALVPPAALGAAVAAVLALVAIVWSLVARREGAGRGRKGPAAFALIGSIVFLGWLAAVALPGLQAPPIHDVTTDLDEPPGFTALPLARDNLRGVDKTENWRSIHREHYGNLVPLVTSAPPEQVVAEAAQLAEERGWNIAQADPASGRLEATDTVSYYRFHDDVVLRAAPVGDGSTRVDMRSVSRVGVSDLGYNAARIRDFLGELGMRLPQ